MYHKYLGFRVFAKYGEWGKFAVSVGHPKAKRFSAKPPWPRDQGFCPGPRSGLCPQTSVIGSRSALAMCVHPTFFDLMTWRHPWLHIQCTNVLCLESEQSNWCCTILSKLVSFFTKTSLSVITRCKMKISVYKCDVAYTQKRKLHA